MKCSLVLVALAAVSSVTARRRGGGRPQSSSTGDAPVDVGPPAFLTPLLEARQVSEAQNASRNDPLLGDVESYSGFLTVDKARGANLFFWFFPADKGMEDAPLVLWLQGGPGTSSLFGLFMENGPVRLKRSRRLKHRRHSWTRAASMLYIDSPAGTGFSFASSPQGLATSSEQVGRDLLAALRQFYQLFPQLQGNEFFIAGESYAGKYVPALGMAIHGANTEASGAGGANDSVKINLRGLAVGNPHAEPESMLEYGDYLYQIGLVDEAGRRQLDERRDVVRDLLQQRRWSDAWLEWDALVGAGPRDCGGVNTTLFLELTGLRHRSNYVRAGDHLLTSYKQYVQTPQVRQLLHVGNLTFHNCTAVADQLRADQMQTARPWYETLLEHYDVLLYNGQLDIAEPYPLMVNYIKRLQWSGADAYKTAERKIWTVDGEVAGYAKTAGRLTEVLVRAAGSMVPLDQPKWALDLITKFVSHQPIASAAY
ncbi:venom serine carboxypeptidase-like [Frankliniella occidentalis]|uniref:Carboxypeptidase n=1 Tax=Frankliniella occidentalis TaxID=133901 RepID=A0A6J1T9D0_FRAOC|nr:venom serine carboxypeptidase-like [Frankliniella occidentalis]